MIKPLLKIKRDYKQVQKSRLVLLIIIKYKNELNLILKMYDYITHNYI